MNESNWLLTGLVDENISDYVPWGQAVPAAPANCDAPVAATIIPDWAADPAHMAAGSGRV